MAKQTAQGHSPEKKKNSGRKGQTRRYRMFIFVCSALLTTGLVLIANDFLAITKGDKPATVVIEENMSVGEIADVLKDNGVIQFKWPFELFSTITKSNDRYKYGTYDLNSNMDYLELISRLKKRAQSDSTVWVTIPEGRELREIFKTLEENGVATVEGLTNAMNTHEFDYAFLKDLPERENKLEGYLFPDTYEFYKNEDPVNVLDKMLKNFNNKYDEECQERAKELGMTTDEVITLASIIEREAANDDDRDTVASVFVNRLNSTEYPYLQSCATVQYVLKERKAVLSIEDTKIDSPYNTYQHKGLPVGPIASPGKASIEAALWPEETDYYFFVLGSNGQHIFSKTLAEHNQAIKDANADTSFGTGTVR